MDQSRLMDVPEEVVESDQRQMVFVHVTVELNTLFDWQSPEPQPSQNPGSGPGPSGSIAPAPGDPAIRGPTVTVKGRKDIRTGAFALLSAPWAAYKNRFLLTGEANPDQPRLATVTAFGATFARKPVFFALSRIVAVRATSPSGPSSSTSAANTLLLDLDPEAVAWVQIPRQQLEEDLGLPANSNAPTVRTLQHYHTEPTSLCAMQHYLATAEHLLQPSTEVAAQPGPAPLRPFPPAPGGRFSALLQYSSSHVEALEAAANLASCTSSAGTTPTQEQHPVTTTTTAATGPSGTTTTTAAATTTTAAAPVDVALSGQERPSAVRSVRNVKSRRPVVPASPAVSPRPVTLLQVMQQSEVANEGVEGPGGGGGGGDASGDGGDGMQVFSGVAVAPTTSKDGKVSRKRISLLPEGEESPSKRQHLRGQNDEGDTSDSEDRGSQDDESLVHEGEGVDEDKGAPMEAISGQHAQQLEEATPQCIRQLEAELNLLRQHASDAAANSTRRLEALVQEMQLEKAARQRMDEQLAQERAARAEEAQKAAANARSLEELGQEVRWERADRLAAEAEVAAVLRRADEVAAQMSHLQQQHEETMEVQRRAGQVALAAFQRDSQAALQQLEQQLADLQQRYEAERNGRLAAERRIQDLRREHGAKEAAGRAPMETFLSSVKRAVHRYESETTERGRSGELEMGEVEAAASGCM